jgi:Flp pilus assembly protein TadG
MMITISGRTCVAQQTWGGNPQYGTQRAIRGAITVEFALLVIPLLLIVFGVAEYSRALYQYNTLIKAVRDSVRYISQHNPADAASYAVALNDARCLAVHGNTGCSGPSLAPGLTTDMVGITSNPTTTAAGTSITLVEVRITGYAFQFVFNPLRLADGFAGNDADTISFGEVHSTMRQI